MLRSYADEVAGVEEEVSDVERYRGDDGPEARFLCRGEEAQLRRVAAHVDYRGHACGVAVDMGGAVAGAAVLPYPGGH